MSEQFEIKITANASQAVQAGQDIAKSIDSIAKTSVKAGDDGSKALDGMAKTSVKAGDDGSKALEEIAKTCKETGSTVETETKKTVSGQSQIKAALQGISHEFPLLGEVGRMALNRITLAVAGITAAFQLWTWRLKELQDTYSRGQMPDVSTSQVERIQAASKGWGGYAEAFAKVTAAYESVAATSDRAMKRFDKEFEQKKKLLEAEKGLALARLESERDNLAPGEYHTRKAAIENAYEMGAFNLDAQARQKQLEEKARRRDALAAEAQAKEKEAAAMHPADPHEEALIEARLKKSAEAAEAEVKRRRERLGELADWEASEGSFKDFRQAYAGFRMASRYGYNVNFKQARELEHSEMDTAQSSIDAYENFMRNKTARQAARDKKQGLLQGADASMSESIRLGLELPDDRAAANDAQRHDRQVAATHEATRGYQTLSQLGTDQSELLKEVEMAVKSGKGVSQEMIEAMRGLRASYEDTKKELRNEINSLRRITGNQRAD